MAIEFSPDFVAIVTGAASGIGEGIAADFVRAGATVIAADINPIAKPAADGGRLIPRTLDVTSEAGWTSLIDGIISEYGRLDCLVNVAGCVTVGGIEDLKLDAFDRMIDVNLRSIFISTQQAIRAMKAQDGSGSIINIASANALKAQSWTSGYAASKAAVMSLTRTSALHCAEQKYPIRINAILPGIVRTPMVEGILASAPDREVAFAELASAHPTGRLLEVSEIAAVATFLASPLASGILGAGLSVDCGMTAG